MIFRDPMAAQEGRGRPLPPPAGPRAREVARKAPASHCPSPQLPRGGGNDQRCRQLPASAGRQSRARAWSGLQRFFPFPTPAWHLRPTRPVQSVRSRGGAAPSRLTFPAPSQENKTATGRRIPGWGSSPRPGGSVAHAEIRTEGGARGSSRKGSGWTTGSHAHRTKVFARLWAPAARTVRYADSLADGGSNGFSTPLRGSCGNSLFALSF